MQALNAHVKFMLSDLIAVDEDLTDAEGAIDVTEEDTSAVDQQETGAEATLDALAEAEVDAEADAEAGVVAAAEGDVNVSEDAGDAHAASPAE